MTNLKNFSLIVSTHDDNLPITEIYEKYAQKYFQLNNNIKKYLICENSPKNISYFDHVITNKPKKSWSKQLIDSLSKINSEYIIYCLEDFIFYKKTDSIKLNYYLNWAYDKKVRYLRLMPKPKGFKKVERNIYELGPYALYKNSLFLTVWNKDYLLKILKNYKTPWEFEVLGTRHVRHTEGYYTINEKFIYFHHLVAKGSFINRSFNKLKLDNSLTSYKKKLNPFYEISWQIKKELLKLYELIPDNFIKYHIYYLFK